MFLFFISYRDYKAYCGIELCLATQQAIIQLALIKEDYSSERLEWEEGLYMMS